MGRDANYVHDHRLEGEAHSRINQLSAETVIVTAWVWTLPIFPVRVVEYILPIFLVRDRGVYTPIFPARGCGVYTPHY